MNECPEKIEASIKLVVKQSHICKSNSQRSFTMHTRLNSRMWSSVLLVVLIVSKLLNSDSISFSQNIDDPYVQSEILARFLPSAGVFTDGNQVYSNFSSQIAKILNNQVVSSANPLFPRKPQSLSSYELDDIFKIQLRRGVDLFHIIELLSKEKDVAYAQPNYILSTQQVDVVNPNNITPTTSDPYQIYQYALENNGLEGVIDADIDASNAWMISSGSTTIRVAVIDTGIFNLHPDLNDGRVLMSEGWDYVNNDSLALDDQGHGTHVAGIIGAEQGNNEGIAGVNALVSLIPLKVCNNQGSCNTDHIAQAIRYAADINSHVINLSLGGPGCNNALTDAVNYAHFDKGVTVVAAAGNDGGSVGSPASVAASIAVGATNSYDQLADFSNRGTNLDITAPGVAVWSAVPQSTYDAWSGTSMAAPFVAGVAALLYAANPNLTNEQVREALFKGAEDRGSAGYDTTFGHGRLNAHRSLMATIPDSPIASERTGSCSVCGASAAAQDSADGVDLLTNIRMLRDSTFSVNPGARWSSIYYEHQVEVALMLLQDGDLRSDVINGWYQFNSVFLRLMNEDVDPVYLTPELIDVAERIFLSVARQGSPEVHRKIHMEWDKVNPYRFEGMEVRDVWQYLVNEESRSQPYVIFMPHNVN